MDITSIMQVRMWIFRVMVAPSIGLLFGSASFAQDATGAYSLMERGIAHRQRGEYAKAIAAHSEALRINPRLSDAYYNRGYAYSEIGQQQQAIRDYSEAIRISPRAANPYYNRAIAYEEIGESTKAIADYTAAMELGPTRADSYTSRGRTFLAAGKYPEAEADLDRALRMAPYDMNVLANAAWLKATCPVDSLRDGAAAVRMATRACHLTKWNEPDYIEALAAGYAETGDFDRALKFQRQAMASRRRSFWSATERQKHLAAYETRQPYRQRAASRALARGKQRSS